MNSIKDSNQILRDFLQSSPDILKQNLFHPENPADGNFAIAYKNHILRVKKALETNGTEAIPSMAALKALNSGPIGTGRLVNPLFPFGPPPGASGVMPDSADVTNSGEPLVENAVRRDFLKQESLAYATKMDELNLYTDKSHATNKFYIDTELLDSLGVAGTRTEELNKVQFSVPDFSRLFTEKNSGFDFGSGEKGFKSFKPKRENRTAKTSDFDKRATAIENSDAFFSKTELTKGYVGPDEFDSVGIEESTNYLPFFFEDMRMQLNNRRRIYFRAFLTSLRESLAPSWTKEEFFGRVEPVGSYKGTSRSISVGFVIVAMSYPGFTAMWRKVNQFAKLVYPTFRNGVMIKGPISRMRIGDLICDTNGNGLPGYISSPIEFDYTDSPWEITQWVGPGIVEPGKAPMMIKVNLTFDVIHETTPKLDENGNFDTTNFRRVGGLTEAQESPSDQDSITFTEEEVAQ